MQIPKLMWLKRHLPASWARLGMAFDLADFLSWRATGNPARSQCTLTCKWSYLAHETPGWPEDFLAATGLADLRARAGRARARNPGRHRPRHPDARAPRASSASRPATRVAAGLIDAHAGALGVLGHLAGTPEIERHVALIAGTSSCVMTFAAAPRFVPGIWGPYLGGALPGLWLSEGGQSASGALLDHLLRLHGHAATPALHARVAARIAELRAVTPDLAPRLHVLPDFHGSRSPDPDPQALGVISGLPLDASFDALCRLYWRTSVAIALGLRLVLEHLRAHGQTRRGAAPRRRPRPQPAPPRALRRRHRLPHRRARRPGRRPPRHRHGRRGRLRPPPLARRRRRRHAPGRHPARPRPRRRRRRGRDWQAFQAMRRHRAELDRI